MSRPFIRWFVAIACGFLIAAVIVNLTLPILVDIETPQWFMKTFPIFGGPVLWLIFAVIANLILKALWSRSR